MKPLLRSRYQYLLLVGYVTVRILSQGVPALANEPEFIHTQMTNLPPASERIVLETHLAGIRDIDLPVFAHIVVDGRLQLIRMEGRFDARDRSLYKVRIPPPRGELSYRFVLLDPNGPVVRSPLYRIRRECLPSPVLSESRIPEGISEPQRAVLLVSRSKQLEEEIRLYSIALELLEQLSRALVGRIK